MLKWIVNEMEEGSLVGFLGILSLFISVVIFVTCVFVAFYHVGWWAGVSVLALFPIGFLAGAAIVWKQKEVDRVVDSLDR